MRYAVISDVHGNLPALSAVLADAALRGVGGHLFLGDYYMDLPYINEVMGIIGGIRGMYAVRGNKEEYFFDLNPDKSTWVFDQFAPLYYSRDKVTPESLRFMQALPDEIYIEKGEERIRMFHAANRHFSGTSLMELGSGKFYHMMKKKPVSHGEYLDYIKTLQAGDNALRGILGQNPPCAYLFGHTHIQWHSHMDGCLLLNPGACGMPLDFDVDAPYSIIEYKNGGWTVEEYRVKYDLDGLISEFCQSDLYKSAGVWGSIVTGQLRTAEERVSFIFDYAREIQQAAGETGEVFSNKTWSAAAALWKERFL